MINHPLATRKKPSYPICPDLRRYLQEYGREVALPTTYEVLRDFREAYPLRDSEGNDTLWESVLYDSVQMKQLREDLTRIYAILKVDGDLSVMRHLYVDRIDFCTFGNSSPFRIRIVNSYNDNQDYYYIKKADASRIYGLELEHVLSPNRMNYLTHGNTLVEEHVVGIPGDMFITQWLHSHRLKPVRLAKELVKFNERCFVRLLGDMRSYNFVLDVSPDFEEVQIRIRAMDFDQQSYHGRKNFYLPQFFKENTPLAIFCMKHLNPTTALQYQREEHALIMRRANLSRERLDHILDVMAKDRISTREKVYQLRDELANHYRNRNFRKCESMGEIIRESLDTIRQRMKRPTDPSDLTLFASDGSKK